MAYRGTANNAAIQKLLHFAVGDVSDDVRRAAVLNLGFVLMNVPEQCPRIVRLLSESYNPHVRYGACVAMRCLQAVVACCHCRQHHVIAALCDSLMLLDSKPMHQRWLLLARA